MSQQVAKTDLASQMIIDRLRKAGFKITTPRKELIDTFVQLNAPCTVDDIQKKLQASSLQVHRATIYRDIQHFIQAGIIRELMITGGSAMYYELLTDDHHHHFVCTQCFSIQAIKPEVIEQAIRVYEEELLLLGLEVKSHQLKFYGLCRSCKCTEGESFQNVI
jgi:Fe2+ or Zn2+ uptake regulation protein